MTMQTPSKAKQLLEIVFEGHEVRYALVEGRLLFVQNDIGAAIDLRKSALKRAVRLLDSDEKGGSIFVTPFATQKVKAERVLLDTDGGPQHFASLTESGVYHLILMSRKPAAKRFRKFFTGEVMPQMVKYGSYIPGATPSEQLAWSFGTRSAGRRAPWGCAPANSSPRRAIKPPGPSTS